MNKWASWRDIQQHINSLTWQTHHTGHQLWKMHHTCIKVNTCSNISWLAATLPGSTLNPIFFNCYIKDIPKKPMIKNLETLQMTQHSWHSQSIQTAVVRLNSHICKYNKWCENWKIVINPTKTTYIHLNTF
ncbi:hypothetical protein J437_LFUL012964 [Ladona fulva]|uniref:Uncharacterized protein n=1 Tax=Ladona fulva TaxID=123851 RepID=A0A8K0KKA9_LADFU|nr:hypothetical protein J437_LFUL012964 [Ladona fulva]